MRRLQPQDPHEGDITTAVTPGKVRKLSVEGKHNPLPGQTGETVNGENHMAELCWEVLTNPPQRHYQIQFVELPAEELLAEDDDVARYRLRYDTLKLHVATSKTLSPTQFKGAVQAHLRTMIDRYAEVMPGSYRPVAVRVVRSSKLKWFKVAADASSHRFVTNEGSEPTYHDSDQKTKRVKGEEPYLMFEFAYADVSQRAPTDWLFENRGSRVGGTYKYAESGGKLLHLPHPLRTARRKAEAVIRYFYDVPEGAVFAAIGAETIAKAQGYLAMTLSTEEAAKLLGVDATRLQDALDALPSEPALCSEPDCGNKARTQGLCAKHRKPQKGAQAEAEAEAQVEAEAS